MIKWEILQRLKGQLIASCQTYEGNPLHGIENMATMARCVLAGGIKRIRICRPESVRIIRVLTDAPLMGINKVTSLAGTDFYDSVFITPNYEPAVAVIKVGCDAVTPDGALRGRNEKELTELTQRLKATYPDIVLMADLVTIERGIIREKARFDILSSTLSGHTRDTMHNNLDGPDIQLIRELESRASCLVSGGGKIWDSKQPRNAQAARADMVTMGDAITNPMRIAVYLIDQVKE